MTTRTYRSEQTEHAEVRRPALPTRTDMNSRLFLGWGPRV